MRTEPNICGSLESYHWSPCFGQRLKVIIQNNITNELNQIWSIDKKKTPSVYFIQKKHLLVVTFGPTRFKREWTEIAAHKSQFVTLSGKKERPTDLLSHPLYDPIFSQWKVNLGTVFVFFPPPTRRRRKSYEEWFLFSTKEEFYRRIFLRFQSA